MKAILLFFSAVIVVSCSSPVKIIKNEQPFFDEKIEMRVRDRAVVDIPFVPASVKIYATDFFTAEWKKDKVTVKGVDEGQGRIVLFDKDGVRTGSIIVIIKPGD